MCVLPRASLSRATLTRGNPEVRAEQLLQWTVGFENCLGRYYSDPRIFSTWSPVFLTVLVRPLPRLGRV